MLNLSKTAGSGSVGEHSGSEAGASHRSQDDEEEEENLSEDLEDDHEKDEGTSLTIYLFQEPTAPRYESAVGNELIK